MKPLLLLVVAILILSATACSSMKKPDVTPVESRASDGSCPGGGTISVLLPTGDKMIPIYVGNEPRTYRITGLSAPSSLGQDIPVVVSLDGTPNNSVTFNAFVANGTASGVSPNSVDVEGQKIELSFRQPEPAREFLQLCFFRIN